MSNRPGNRTRLYVLTGVFCLLLTASLSLLYVTRYYDGPGVRTMRTVSLYSNELSVPPEGATTLTVPMEEVPIRELDEQVRYSFLTGTGELLIRGEQIKRLILRDGKGEQRVLSEPGSRVVLPVGEYRLHEVTLQGDHSCQLGPFPADGRLTVDPNIPVTLKVGAPLRQVIEVKRQGSIMGLTYELIGQGGERYSINREQNSPAPSFAVYKGNRKVASGDFEFG